MTKIITIDGPAGSGKSTVAVRLAARLGLAYLDTGAMYRAATLAALEQNVPLDEPAVLAELLGRCRIELARPEAPERVFLNGRDVTEGIRSPRVTEQAHYLAGQPALRRGLVEQQRRIAQQCGGLVTEGRDQGTVAFPQAQWKFYLDADPAERARRRWRQRQEKGETVALEEVLAAQQQRDRRDLTRAVGPLRVPDGALVIDTTHLTVAQVVDTLYRHVVGQGD